MPRKRYTQEDDGPVFDPMDPDERMLRFRMANARFHGVTEEGIWSKNGVRKENERPAWAGGPSKYEREVDPEKKLPWQERDRRAQAARRLAHARRQLADAQARLERSPEDEATRRKLRAAAGRIGGLTRSMSGYTRDMASAAREANGSLDRFERQVDPDVMLDPQVRRRRALAARKRYYKKLSKLGQKTKERKRRAKEAALKRRLARYEQNATEE